VLISRLCKFYRSPDTLDVGRDIGYCDLDCDQTTCDGDLDSCQNPLSLKTYLLEQVKRDGRLEWNRRKNVHFLFMKDPMP